MYTQVIELPKIFNLTLPCRASLTPGAPSLGTPTPFGYACGTPRANASRLGRETPSGSPDAWLSGDPPAALVSPPAALVSPDT
ncbi:hypothetical protein [Brasilonema sennae]|uniref:hypothetical protein n=1 Tax=Brasilonema sennae TaxID=1397703 RepID=UPI001552D25A|nr:hypothetical protein [Brasilonema sennae]